MLESAIQKSILDWLKTLPDTWAVKVIACNRNGTCDILVCHKGRFLAIEVKTPIGKVSPIQQVQIDRINAAGGHAIVARSLKEVQQFINNLIH